MLAAPINSLLLQSLAEGRVRQSELREAAGSPAQTTLRAHLRALGDIGAIAIRRRNRFPGVLEFNLTAAGKDLLGVVAILGQWLERAPGGPLGLGTSAARAAVGALAKGWSTTILRALAARPLSLTELDHIIAALSYPSLERGLSAMRLAGQIEATPSTGRGTPYAVTKWLRQGVAPLAAATRWERRHLPERTPAVTRIDTEAAFLLMAPLLRLSNDLSGACRMAMEIPNGSNSSLAGILIDVKDGKVASCTTRLRGNTDAWASGSTEAWLTALIDADSDGLELGGDSRLARTFLEGLHDVLFRVPIRR